jgi:hypothetical protein
MDLKNNFVFEEAEHQDNRRQHDQGKQDVAFFVNH